MFNIMKLHEILEINKKKEIDGLIAVCLCVKLTSGQLCWSIGQFDIN